jgi:hypothetical protein
MRAAEGHQSSLDSRSNGTMSVDGTHLQESLRCRGAASEVASSRSSDRNRRKGVLESPLKVCRMSFVLRTVSAQTMNVYKGQELPFRLSVQQGKSQTNRLE